MKSSSYNDPSGALTMNSWLLGSLFHMPPVIKPVKEYLSKASWLSLFYFYTNRRWPINLAHLITNCARPINVTHLITNCALCRFTYLPLYPLSYIASTSHWRRLMYRYSTWNMGVARILTLTPATRKYVSITPLLSGYIFAFTSLCL